MNCAVFGFRPQEAAANRLADELGISHRLVTVKKFPDGESLVRVETPPKTALLYRSLDHPNDKIVELLLAAAALRSNGAASVMLIVPYLAYMRQDIAFHSGEAVSQRVVGKLLADHFDGVLTLDPHLHRTRSLAQIMPGTEAATISAAPLLAASINAESDPLLVGPDGEARQWVERIADGLGLEFILGRKCRHGDRKISLAIPDAERAAGRRVIIVDDIVSSGVTLAAALDLLRGAGALQVDALATHCLADEANLEELRRAGMGSIAATDSVTGPFNTIRIAPLVAREVRRLGWNS